MRIINYNYKIPYKEVRDFAFERKNEIVSFEGYTVLVDMIKECSNILNKNKDARYACATLNRFDDQSCLINVQFLILEGTLKVIANYRSQHSELGRPYDEELINYFTTLFLKQNSFELDRIDIVCNVGDYHDAY